MGKKFFELWDIMTDESLKNRFNSIPSGWVWDCWQEAQFCRQSLWQNTTTQSLSHSKENPDPFKPRSANYWHEKNEFIVDLKFIGIIRLGPLWNLGKDLVFGWCLVD